jgi:long-chain acyl-CoA synthetase
MTLIWELERHGKATAIITPQGEHISYAELARRADTMAEKLPKTRSLGIIQCRNRPETLIAYMANLRHGHAALLVDGDIPKEQLGRLKQAYEAEWLVNVTGEVTIIGRSGSEMDPRAALLLSTSGSTGSPKQVVLSADNLNANAASIAEYLEIGAKERPITTLPFQYSYGLSVINSHLRQGSTLLMTDDAITTREFWDFFKTEQATSLAGVPTVYEMLQRLHLERMELSSLRTLTQAGGRLGTQLVKHFAHMASDKGWHFFVMYGQTEATARMAYLPAAMAEEYADCIGIAIPGGEFRLEDCDGNAIEANDVEGELVYRGPNIMQGYACNRADLRQLSPLEELHTGDLALRNNAGLYRITGRLKRIIKLYGNRVALDEVEQTLQGAGFNTICGGDDQRLIIAHHPREDTEAVKRYINEKCRIPVTAIQCVALEAWPTTESGKIAYHKLADLA